jgi:hypothetical protein
MQPVAIAVRVQRPTYRPLGSRVFAADSSHHFRTYRSRNFVRHNSICLSGTASRVRQFEVPRPCPGFSFFPSYVDPDHPYSTHF